MAVESYFTCAAAIWVIALWNCLNGCGDRLYPAVLRLGYRFVLFEGSAVWVDQNSLPSEFRVEGTRLKLTVTLSWSNSWRNSKSARFALCERRVT